MEMGYLQENLNSIFGVRGTDSREVMVRTLETLEPFGKPVAVDPDVRYDPYGNSICSDLNEVCTVTPRRRRH